MTTDCQFALLQKRLISTGRRDTVAEIVARYQQLTDSGLNPIVLMPTVAMCAEVNAAMLSSLGEEVHTLLADDKQETIVTKKQLPKVIKAYEKLRGQHKNSRSRKKAVPLSARRSCSRETRT